MKPVNESRATRWRRLLVGALLISTSACTSAGQPSSGAGSGSLGKAGLSGSSGGANAVAGSSPAAGGLGGFTSAGGGDGSAGTGGPSLGSGGAGGAGNAAGQGGAAQAGSSGGSRSPRTAVYNGLRGESFNRGWKFNRGDVSDGQSASFDDSAWRAVTVPHDWSIELAFSSSSPSGSSGGYLDGGIGWYRKSFTLSPASAGKRILIEFDGVYMNSEVWINGTSLGTRPYGYSTFEYDLTPYVTFGASNVIAVRVNNNQPNSRWYSGSGIYRNVWLTALDPVHIPYDGVFVSTPSVSTGSATVSVSTEVQNQSAGAAAVTVTMTILTPSGAVA